jgi:hypothetical protein
MRTPPTWLTRWQQRDEDELDYAPQDGGRGERLDAEEGWLSAVPWISPGLGWSAESLRQMARERWPEAQEDASR